MSGSLGKNPNGRYTIKVGKYGAYFFDRVKNVEIDLEQALVLINKSTGRHQLKNAINLMRSNVITGSPLETEINSLIDAANKCY